MTVSVDFMRICQADLGIDAVRISKQRSDPLDVVIRSVVDACRKLKIQGQASDASFLAGCPLA